MSKRMSEQPDRKQTAERVIRTPQSFNGVVKGVCDILRRSNCAGAMQYIPELTWILFLRILDDKETFEAEKAAAADEEFVPSLGEPYRWRDWGSPYRPTLIHDSIGGKPRGWKRNALIARANGALLNFVNNELFPHLKALSAKPQSTPRQKIVGEIASCVDRTRIDTEYNLLEVLDSVDRISADAIDRTHIFPLSQIYEGLLLRMGQKSNDGGQFFTPREVVRAMVRVVDPRPGETIYDPCCGTGGFLAQAFEHVAAQEGPPAARRRQGPGRRCGIYGREKENLVYPLALANLVLHGIDEPKIWHGNTLTGDEVYGELFHSAPEQFDVILTNPPFGGKESKQAQARFSYPSSSTQLLFLQHVVDSLSPNGRCGIVVDEGVLFRTNETAFVRTKQSLLQTCNLWCIVSLPIGTFLNAGASIKTNLLFFTKGSPTEKIWYYDLSDVKISKAAPLSAAHFDEFFRLLPDFAAGERSWSVTRQQIDENGYDLKAVNPHVNVRHDGRSLDDLLLLLDRGHREIQDQLQALGLQRSTHSVQS
jgi:type I restriction enzyme M protein